jgi:hypothetical protein
MNPVLRKAYFLVITALPGCASVPDVTVNYYLPRGVLQTTVVRTIACDVQNNVFLASTVIAKPVYSRDPGSGKSLKLKDLNGAFANADVGLTFYEDGRLSGLNVTQTGQGGEILKSAVLLAGAVLAAWTGSIAVPQRGRVFMLPIPHAAMFGKQSFGLALAESGAITTLKYAEESGLSSGMSAATAAFTEFRGDTTAESAAKLKAEADVIAQQQRLIRCQLNPAGCT